MIVLGVILLVLGWLLGISVLYYIGGLLLLLGLLFLLLGGVGHPVGGRQYWY